MGCLEGFECNICLWFPVTDVGEMVEGVDISIVECSRSRDICGINRVNISLGIFSRRSCSCGICRNYTGTIGSDPN